MIVFQPARFVQTRPLPINVTMPWNGAACKDRRAKPSKDDLGTARADEEGPADREALKIPMPCHHERLRKWGPLPDVFPDYAAPIVQDVPSRI
jgi:hypothetical protein